MKQGTKLLLKNYMELYGNYTISGIAEICGVSQGTVYNRLEDIARANNLSREDLLYHVHKPHMKAKKSNLVETLDGLIGEFEKIIEETRIWEGK